MRNSERNGARAREPSQDHVVKEGTAQLTKSSKDSSQLKKLNQYTIQKMLGQGAYGQVFMASDERGETVAIKVINKSVLKKKSMGARGASALDTLAREIAVMKKINHPHCVQLFEVIDDPKDEKLYLVMELLTGGEVAASLDVPPPPAACRLPPAACRLPPATLRPATLRPPYLRPPPCALCPPRTSPAALTRQAMHKDNLPPGQEHLPESAARQIFRDLLIGLEYLHAQGIIHRDIKPENLVFQAAPDYGRARAASSVSPRSSSRRTASSCRSSARDSTARESRAASWSRDSSCRESSACRPSLPSLSSSWPWRRASKKLAYAEAGAGAGAGGGGSGAGGTGGASLQAIPSGSLLLPAHGAGGEFSGVALAEGGGPAPAAAAPARGRWSLFRRGKGGGGDGGEAGVAAVDPSLVRHAPRIKLLDFGVAAICREHEALEALEVHGGSGTPSGLQPGTQPDGKRDDSPPGVRRDDSLIKSTGTPAFYAPEMCVKGAYHGAPAPRLPASAASSASSASPPPRLLRLPRLPASPPRSLPPHPLRRPRRRYLGGGSDAVHAGWGQAAIRGGQHAGGTPTDSNPLPPRPTPSAWLREEAATLSIQAAARCLPPVAGLPHDQRGGAHCAAARLGRAAAAAAPHARQEARAAALAPGAAHRPMGHSEWHAPATLSGLRRDGADGDGDPRRNQGAGREHQGRGGRQEVEGRRAQVARRRLLHARRRRRRGEG